MLPMARFAQKSFTFFHVGEATVMSLVYHSPPATPPAHIFFLVASFGSNIIARVLPPTLLGPRSVHTAVVSGSGLTSFCASCFRTMAQACVNRSLGTYPRTGSFVLSMSCCT